MNGKNLANLTVFAIAMAYLETAVVVHLRTIFYPEGFAFPLKDADLLTYGIELGREAATILMLIAVVRLSAPPGWGRFASFAFLFGVWDIWYYVWLKVLLNWPESLLTWDVLFLIPVVWIGPVLAPVLISLLLVAGSLAAMCVLDRGGRIRLDRWDWTGGFAGALLIFYTFMSDMTAQVIRGGVQAATAFVPAAFNWPVFLTGFALMTGFAWRILRRAS